MTEDAENTNRGMAAGFTIGFHAVLVFFIFFYIIKTPIPPYPDLLGGSGLEVNFGNSDKGFGNNQSEELIPVQTTQLSGSKSDNFITQDNDNTSSIASSTNPNKTTNVIQINDPVDKSLLYHKKAPNQGIAGGTGNQGKPNGTVGATNYTGSGGTGGGTGGGSGTGVGPNTGPGISYVMKDRTCLSLPKPKYETDDEGQVVVTITCDQNGKVIKATAGARGTTVWDKKSWKNCETAALKATFNKKKDAAIEQKGTITYVFLKQN